MTIDLLPTIAKLDRRRAARAARSTARTSGRSCAASRARSRPHEAYFFYWGQRAAGGAQRASGSCTSRTPTAPSTARKAARTASPVATKQLKTPLALFDLEKDPGEKTTSPRSTPTSSSACKRWPRSAARTWATADEDERRRACAQPGKVEETKTDEDEQEAQRPLPVQRRPALRHDRGAGQRGHPDAEPRPARQGRLRLHARLHHGRHAAGRLRAEPGDDADRADAVPRRPGDRREDADVAGDARPGRLRDVRHRQVAQRPGLVRASFQRRRADLLRRHERSLRDAGLRLRPVGQVRAASRRRGKKHSSELFADAAVEFISKHKERQAVRAVRRLHRRRTTRARRRRNTRSCTTPTKLPLPKNFLPKHPFDNGELNVRDEKLAPLPRTPDGRSAEHLADYYAMITHLDAQVGRIREALEDSEAGRGHPHRLRRRQRPGARAARADGQAEPLRAQRPRAADPRRAGRAEGRKSAALVYLFDLFPTLAELCGVEVPKTVEGKSLVPILTGKKKAVRDSVFAAYRDVQRMVRTERWKLIAYPKIERTQLFDLAERPVRDEGSVRRQGSGRARQGDDGLAEAAGRSRRTTRS